MPLFYSLFEHDGGINGFFPTLLLLFAEIVFFVFLLGKLRNHALVPEKNSIQKDKINKHLRLIVKYLNDISTYEIILGSFNPYVEDVIIKTTKLHVI